MAVSFDTDTGTWSARCEYVNYLGETVPVCRGGFSSEQEATLWELQFQLERAKEPDMPLGEFLNVYHGDIAPRVRESTMEGKRTMAEKWIRPHLGHIPLRDLTARDVLHLQNTLMTATLPDSGRKLSRSYVRKIHHELCAVLNHAVVYYQLRVNQAQVVGVPQKKYDEMKIWTREEYLRFARAVRGKPLAYICFEMLYWCGLREGELLALTPEDVDLDRGTVSISKTFYKEHGVYGFHPPKTSQSRRTVTMPRFLCREVENYIRTVYRRSPSPRLFPTTKYMLTKTIHRGAEEAGLPRIRVHDLRHSHVSLLIRMGYSVTAIGARVGHKSTEITYRYAHMFPTEQQEMVLKLSRERRNLA